MTISGLALAGVAGVATLFALDSGSENDPKNDAGDRPVAEAPPAPDVSAGDSIEMAVPVEAGAATQDEDAPDTDEDESAPQSASRSLDFTRGTVDDLRKIPLSGMVEKIAAVPGVAEKTKVWVAKSDVASAPGMETLYHVKGPLTCGSVGCDLLVVDQSQSVLLNTVGESVVSPEIDTLIINQGTAKEATWVFNGAEFTEKK